jgi:hypothetical protein
MKTKADEWRESVQDESMDEVGDEDDAAEEQQQDNKGEDLGMELEGDARGDDDDFMEDEGEEGIGVEQGVGSDDFMDGCYALDIDVDGIEGSI